MKQAVIGIGSNSTRMLLAVPEGGRLTQTQRMREGTRLFAGLEAGVLSADSMARTADAVLRFAMAAREAGVAEENLYIIATCAARDAQNGEDFLDLVEALCGIRPQILSGEEEAALSFRGGAGSGYCGMVDIGGGSTEIAMGGGGRPFTAMSAQLGAVRLLGEAPLLYDESVLAHAYALAQERVQAVWPDARMDSLPVAWYGVGGTITCLASLDKRLPVFDRDAVDGHALKRKNVENWARRLSKMSVEERDALPGMLPTRADVIAHGTLVLWAVMDWLNIDRILASNRTNLDGFLLRLNEGQAAESPVESVRSFYNASVEKEWARLEENPFEFAINKRFIDRYVQPGSRVLDVGGGPGRYALHLAQRGAEVTLLDLSEGNVTFAHEKAKEAGHTLYTVCCDARELEKHTSGLFDVILLMGPLYHLLEEADRVQTVEACLRRLKPGGVLCAAFISIVGGMVYALRELPESIMWPGEAAFYQKIIAGEDFAGEGFTHAYMIQPGHVRPFMERFPLETLHMAGSEGITAPYRNQLLAETPEVREAWLEVAASLAEREDFFSCSEHLLYIGRKKEEAT